jgi:hypothetical protein
MSTAHFGIIRRLSGLFAIRGLRFLLRTRGSRTPFPTLINIVWVLAVLPGDDLKNPATVSTGTGSVVLVALSRDSDHAGGGPRPFGALVLHTGRHYLRSVPMLPRKLNRYSRVRGRIFRFVRQKT